MKTSIATITLTGLTPYSQSRQHDDPMLEGEGRDAYDARTWRSKQNVAIRDGKPTVVIPAHGFHQAMIAAAKYSKRQIPGQGKATWTKKFEAGISLLEDPSLNIDPNEVQVIAISANADGVRGSGKRVMLQRMPNWALLTSTTLALAKVNPRRRLMRVAPAVPHRRSPAPRHTSGAGRCVP